MTQKTLNAPLAPGATLGILGGGQLGRMLAQATQAMGYKAHIFCPEKDACALDVTPLHTIAAYDDDAALKAFADAVDAVTYEFENIPLPCVKALAPMVPVYPDATVLATSQHRAREKNAMRNLGIETAPFAIVEALEECEMALNVIGMPAILKTSESGYDGKGQAKVHSLEELQAAFERFGGVPCVLEGVVDFALEISVIVVRGADGKAVPYEAAHNVHTNHILDTSTLPAPISDALKNRATELAIKVAEGLNLRGLLAIELFVTKQEELLVNEVAPRPHNSGHWTMDAATTSQFEQCARAVLGLPLGDPARTCDVQMKNLIGDAVHAWKNKASDATTKIHLYGKKEARAGRKMGHVNHIK